MWKENRWKYLFQTCETLRRREGESLKEGRMNEEMHKNAGIRLTEHVPISSSQFARQSPMKPFQKSTGSMIFYIDVVFIGFAD